MASAWAWLEQNATVLSGLGTLAMAVVWIVYLHLFYIEHRRRHRPRLLIQHANHHRLDAPCLLTNMSEEMVFIICAYLVAMRGSEEHVRPMSSSPAPADRDAGTLRQTLRQGPLEPGGMISLGSFTDVLGEGEPPQAYDAIEVRLVAIHGPTHHPIGVSRRYLLERGNEGPIVRPMRFETRQFHRPWHRRRVRYWLQYCREHEEPHAAGDGGPARNRRQIR